MASLFDQRSLKISLFPGLALLCRARGGRLGLWWWFPSAVPGRVGAGGLQGGSPGLPAGALPPRCLHGERFRLWVSLAGTWGWGLSGGHPTEGGMASAGGVSPVVTLRLEAGESSGCWCFPGITGVTDPSPAVVGTTAVTGTPAPAVGEVWDGRGVGASCSLQGQLHGLGAGSGPLCDCKLRPAPARDQ